MSERPLRATYRLQLNETFTFADAAKQVPYLSQLGVSHLYLSPVFEAAQGSMHGYDVIDQARLSSVLGGREGFDALVAQAHAHGLGIILDIVPNHMSIADARNAWWWDVLENGPSSRFAYAFDVDWNPPEQQHANRVVLPVLGDHRAKVLERNEISIAREGSKFTVRYFENQWPVAPRALGSLLTTKSSVNARLAFIADGLVSLALASSTDFMSIVRRQRDKDVLYELLSELIERDADVRAAIDEALVTLNADREALGLFLDRQNFRLAFWRTAERELDYRRFFDVSTLVALRMEDPNVFTAAHTLVKELASDGSIDGVRVDHVDGLADPAEYLKRLRTLVGDATIHVEKILGFDEVLPPWPIEGTTGYEHAVEVTQLFLDPASEATLSARERATRGDDRTFEQLATEARAQVLVDLLAADVNRLTGTLVELRERHTDMRDYSRHEMHQTLRALVTAFPVYRSYVAPERGEITDEDRALIDAAVRGAQNDKLDSALLGIIASFLKLERKGSLEGTFVRRFQQLTAPALAKGVEDTAFYRSTRLLALNEVGGSPERFGLSVDDFHRRQIHAQANWPRRLLATSTHDTKRSEDVRARLVAMSWHADEMPRPLEGPIDGPTKEVLLQTFIGAFPIDEARLWQTMEKSIKEAKLSTSWTRGDEAYEKSVKDFVHAFITDPERRKPLEQFVQSIEKTAHEISQAWVALKATLPGVPDFYQGTELWNLSLVDPDNRRPVDFAERASAHTGKIELIRTLLALRKERPELFDASATYRPLKSPEGTLAFSRGERLVVQVKRQKMIGAGALELPAGDFETVWDRDGVTIRVRR